MSDLLSRRLGLDGETFAKPFRPVPGKNDYSRGFIIRYFAKQRNNISSPVVEIDKAQFESHRKSGTGLKRGFYKVISVRWKIRGTLQEIQDANFKVIENSKTLFPGIEYKLGNVLEFWNKDVI